MSHRDTCPDSWEARRQGERAFESGGSRYRYEDDCDEAAFAYRRGFMAAEHRAEQEAEEARLAEQQRRAEREEYEYEEQRQSEADQCAAEARAMEAAEADERDRLNEASQ